MRSSFFALHAGLCIIANYISSEVKYSKNPSQISESVLLEKYHVNYRNYVINYLLPLSRSIRLDIKIHKARTQIQSVLDYHSCIKIEFTPLFFQRLFSGVHVIFIPVKCYEIFIISSVQQNPIVINLKNVRFVSFHKGRIHSLLLYN